MNARFSRTALALAAITVSLAGNALGQRQMTPSHHGFWFSAGLGYGSLGCQDCGSRTGGGSGYLSLGGSLSDKVLLGVSSNGWMKSENGSTLTVNALTAAIRFYPSVNGFFLLGGLGLGTVSGSSVFGSGSETGAGAVLGLGYDLRIGPKVSLTPYWNGFAMHSSNGDANVGQIGLGITVR